MIDFSFAFICNFILDEELIYLIMDRIDIENKLKQINTEDFIWVIYLFIILFSYVANNFERKYYLNGDECDKLKYRKIMITIFFVLLVLYIYFLKDAYNELKKLKETDNYKKKVLVILGFIASFLFTISGAIFLYIAIVDENLFVELAFN